jgi:hypothetical protein
MEDKLQQLCYIVEEFSEENQVEILKTFRFLYDWLPEAENEKGEEEEGKTKPEFFSK